MEKKLSPAVSMPVPVVGSYAQRAKAAARHETFRQERLRRVHIIVAHLDSAGFLVTETRVLSGDQAAAVAVFMKTLPEVDA